MADPQMRQTRNNFNGLIGSTAVVAGDALYFDGTDWELADADDNTKFAEAFATNSYSSGEVGTLCTAGIIVDIDAPYTQGDEQYLSTTAGDITATRPTGANNLVQVLGFALSTDEVHVEVHMPREVVVQWVQTNEDSAAVYDKDGDFIGTVLQDATNGIVGFGFEVPQNVMEHKFSRLWWCGTGTVLDASDTYTIDVSAGVDDETTSATTDGITAAALTVAANDLANADVSAAFDAAGIIEPGNVIGIAVAKAAEGTDGDDPIILGGASYFLVV